MSHDDSLCFQHARQGRGRHDVSVLAQEVVAHVQNLKGGGRKVRVPSKRLRGHSCGKAKAQYRLPPERGRRSAEELLGPPGGDGNVYVV